MKKANLTLGLLLLLITLMFSCSSESHDGKSEIQGVIEHKIKVKDIPDILNFNGNVDAVKSWDDTNGKNYFILATEDVEIRDEEDWYYQSMRWYGYHYIINENDEIIHTRESKDSIFDCIDDLSFKYLLEYFQLTDLDNDKVGEVTLMYKLHCASDVSPDDILLWLFENDVQYDITGTTITDFGGGHLYGGDKVFSKSFNTAPAGFKEFCDSIFTKAVKENSYYDIVE